MKSSRIDEVGRWSSEELLLRAAWFYYKDELTQDEIAKRLSLSRASVGRLLDRARRVGLVSIQLDTEYLNAFELSAELRRVFRLTEALVVPDHDKEPADHHASTPESGSAARSSSSTHLRPGGSLGVGWGETVSRVIAATNFGTVGPVHMVTLTGGVDGYLPDDRFVQGRDGERRPGHDRRGHPRADPRVITGAGRRAARRADHPAGAQARLRS